MSDGPSRLFGREPPDVADALGIALCHYYASQSIVNGARGATFTRVNRAMFDAAPDEVE